MTGIDLSGGRNGKAPVVKLSSGYDLPVVGLGTYALHGSTCVNAVRTALESGYRLIDTASFYGNEWEVGEGVRASGVPREEVVVQTKLYPNQYGHAAQAIEECLSKLDLGYIDILLLHHPASNDVSAYRAIEQAIRDGKVRSAGISCRHRSVAWGQRVQKGQPTLETSAMVPIPWYKLSLSSVTTGLGTAAISTRE